MQRAIDFILGVLTGGLALSICWGLFWLVIGLVGLVRGTCRWRVPTNGLIAGLIPFSLIWVLLWLEGGEVNARVFAAGVTVVPLMLIGLGLRKAPDGRRAGMHMRDGMRHFMDELLGTHKGCGGCDHQHGHEHGGSG